MNKFKKQNYHIILSKLTFMIADFKNKMIPPAFPIRTPVKSEGIIEI